MPAAGVEVGPFVPAIDPVVAVVVVVEDFASSSVAVALVSVAAVVAAFVADAGVPAFSFAVAAVASLAADHAVGEWLDVTVVVVVVVGS